MSHAFDSHMHDTQLRRKRLETAQKHKAWCEQQVKDLKAEFVEYQQRYMERKTLLMDEVLKAEKRIQELRGEMASPEEREARIRTGVCVTAHAIIRFIERQLDVDLTEARQAVAAEDPENAEDVWLLDYLSEVCGFNIDQCRKAILNTPVQNFIRSGVDGQVRFTDKCDAILENGYVITIVPA